MRIVLKGPLGFLPTPKSLAGDVNSWGCRNHFSLSLGSNGSFLLLLASDHGELLICLLPTLAAVITLFFLLRAEPVLTRIKENRKRIISPSFDNIKYDNFEIEEYPLAAQGFDWELWCRYLNPPKAWWKLENSTAPIRCGTLPP